VLDGRQGVAAAAGTGTVVLALGEEQRADVRPRASGQAVPDGGRRGGEVGAAVDALEDTEVAPLKGRRRNRRETGRKRG